MKKNEVKFMRLIINNIYIQQVSKCQPQFVDILKRRKTSNSKEVGLGLNFKPAL